MRKMMLLAGAAALAAAMPALAKNEDRGKGRGGPQAQQVQKGGGQARAERGRGSGQANRGNGNRAEADRGNANRGQANRSQERRQAQAAVREQRQARGPERRAVQQVRRDERQQRPANEVRREDRRDWADRRGRDVRRIDRVERSWAGDERRWRDDPRWRDQRARFASGPQGCPPGLARQNRFCMPPGQLRKAQLIGQRIPVAQWDYNIPDRYRYRFADGDRYYYRYGEDRTVYRFDRSSGLVSGVIPLYASSLYVGEPLPLGYEMYNVPLQYRPYYADTRDHFYRYDDSAIYRVNRESMLIEGIAALLTGGMGGLGSLGVGDSLPGGYDMYNVPLDYRDSYRDGPDAMYRYADGYVYQVDPQTRLIQAVISLLT